MKKTSIKKGIHKIKMNLSGPFWQVVGLGMLAGSRTFSAPVVAGHILSRHPSKNLSKSPLKFMKSANTSLVFKLLAVGELVGDKLAGTPNRTSAPGIIGRCIAGGLAGASIYKASHSNALAGAIVGAAAALGSTFSCYHLRKFAGAKTGIIDPIIGGIEDSLVVAAGTGLIITA